MTEEGRPTSAEGATAVRRTGALRRMGSADFLIPAALLVIFAAAYVAAQKWSFDAKVFPMIVSGVGMALALLRMAVTLRPPRPAVTRSGHAVGGVELKDEDEDSDEALEYVFETASRADWLRVLGWVAGFFLAFYLVGAIPAILAFTVLYLIFEARTTWLMAVLYALALAGTLYAAQELLQILLPRGVLFS